MEKKESLLFLEAAYKIIRVIIITSKRIKEAKEIDIDKIKRELESIISLTGRISEIVTKATTISNNSKFITDTANTLKGELDERLAAVIAQL